MICGYDPQSERSLKEKQNFYYELKGECDMHSAGDLVVCLGDLNGHMSSHIDKFDKVYRGCSVGETNV